MDLGNDRTRHVDQPTDGGSASTHASNDNQSNVYARAYWFVTVLSAAVICGALLIVFLLASGY